MTDAKTKKAKTKDAETEDAKTMATEETPTFTEALEELEEILQRIEGEEIDIDALAAELKRAAELLDLARGKLRRAEVEVTQIVQSLDTAEDETEDIEAEEEEDGGDGPDASGDSGDGQDDIPF